MSTQEPRPTGWTKDTGFQIGARRTLPIHLEDAWELLTSPQGVALWLGETTDLDFTKGATYQLSTGTTGEVRVINPQSHFRITWHPPGWARSSTIQVRVIPKGDRTVVAFHQEHLPGPEAREARRVHYLAVLDKLENIIRSKK